MLTDLCAVFFPTKMLSLPGVLCYERADFCLVRMLLESILKTQEKSENRFPIKTMFGLKYFT